MCVAGAVHLALLFGFPKSPSTRIAKTDEMDPPIVLIRPPPDEVPIAQPEMADAGPKGVPEAPPIRSAEPAPRVDISDRIAVEVPQFPEVRTGELKQVPLGPVGLPDGIENGKWKELITASMLDDAPRTRLQVQPVYPFEAAKTGLSGRVQVEFMVDEDGRVVEPRIVDSTDRAFDEATLRAVTKWRFEPGRRAGRIVRFRMSVPVVFTLHD